MLDSAYRALGTLQDGPGHPEGGSHDTLSVQLSPEVRKALGIEAEDIVLPSDLIHAIRRDQVVLHRSLEDLASFALKED